MTNTSKQHSKDFETTFLKLPNNIPTSFCDSACSVNVFFGGEGVEKSILKEAILISLEVAGRGREGRGSSKGREKGHWGARGAGARRKRGKGGGG